MTLDREESLKRFVQGANDTEIEGFEESEEIHCFHGAQISESDC